jgi:hypothetical protein
MIYYKVTVSVSVTNHVILLLPLYHALSQTTFRTGIMLFG